MTFLGELLDLREAFDEGRVRRDFRGRFADKPSGGKPVGPPRGGPRLRKLDQRELNAGVGAGSWSTGVQPAVEAFRRGDIADTEAAHRERKADGSLGPYTAERAELHGKIASLLLRHAGEHPGRARAVFLAGGPASGKSSLVKSGKVTIPADAVDVNPDIVREMLPEYDVLKAAGDERAAAFTHEEASHLSKLVANIALERHHHLVVDTVGGGNAGEGGRLGGFARRVAAARDAGHEVDVHYVTIPTAEAERRAQKRFERSGRKVPLGYLRNAHRQVTERYLDEVTPMRGIGVSVYDNAGTAPVLIAARSKAQAAVRVADRVRYDAFLRKARGQSKARARAAAATV